MSRSAGYALLAVSRTVPVGADIERITVSPRAALPLASRFLPPAEAALVAAEPTVPARRAAYHRLLSRKESCVKAVGGRFLDGLRLPVPAPGPVAPSPGDPDGVVGGSRWLVDLPAPAGWVASLATVGAEPVPLRLFRWSSPGVRSPVVDLAPAPRPGIVALPVAEPVPAPLGAASAPALAGVVA
nr:4'-phosphopantetheinyl transferase superfamily protein [Streptomyces spiramenti]